MYEGVQYSTVKYCDNMIKSTKHKKKRLIQSESWMRELVLRAAQQIFVAVYAGYMLVSDRFVG